MPKLGFAISSHLPPSTVFIKLLDFLSRIPEAVIVVHHDYSQSFLPYDIIDKYNVHIVRNHAKTSWSHVNKIPAINKTLKKIYELAPDVDWVFTLSANCFPVKSIEYILSKMASLNVDALIKYDKIEKKSWEVPASHYTTFYTRPFAKIPFITRYGEFYIKTLRYPINRESTPFNKNFVPYCASDWMIFNNRSLLRILSKNIEEHSIVAFLAEVNSFGDRLSCPDEIVIPSILLNEHDLVIENEYLRFINWDGTREWHPNFLTLMHYDDIKNSEALFARKLNDEVSLPLVEKIERELL